MAIEKMLLTATELELGSIWKGLFKDLDEVKVIGGKEMKNSFLVEPSIQFKQSFMDFISDVKASGYESYSLYTKAEENFDDFLLQLKESRDGINIPDGWTPCSSYWLIDEIGDVVGVIRIRHKVDSDILQLIGHIGYEIKSTHRNLGYGTNLLRFGLIEAKKLGLDQVLVTCDFDNIGSLKIIEKYNGKYRTSFIDPETNKIVKQFEITTSV